MRTLYIVRHAEAAMTSASGDHGRPLTQRGGVCARELGAMLSRLGQAPEQLLCSDAVRAARTAEAAHAEGGWTADVELAADLYLAPPLTLTAAASRARPGTTRLMLVAHQPGLSEWIHLLTGGPPLSFAPASVARVDLDLSSWGDLAPGSGTLRWMVGPGEAGAFRERVDP
jgi:phosphohistidine phosphatase